MRRARLLAIPPLLVTAGLLVVAVGEPVAPALFDTYRPANAAEAAAAGEAADLLRRLQLGEDDPRRMYDVRPQFISTSVQHATLLEAAMWSRREQMFVMLDRAGLLEDEATRRELACLARDLSLPEIAEYLERGGTVACEPQQALRRVQARTPQS
jgi:hypothetical protein